MCSAWLRLRSGIALSSPVFRYGGALYSISRGITPKRLPQLLNQTELEVNDHIQDSLGGKDRRVSSLLLARAAYIIVAEVRWTTRGREAAVAVFDAGQPADDLRENRN